MIVFDVKAMEAASTREHAGEHCVVSRKWVGDVLAALQDPARIKLVNFDGTGPTPMVVA